jgi:hypothetical protein
LKTIRDGIVAFFTETYSPQFSLPRCNFDIAELETTVTVREQEVELRVGDSVWLGEYRVTVVEIDGDEVVFQVDDSEKSEAKEIRILPR